MIILRNLIFLVALLAGSARAQAKASILNNFQEYKIKAIQAYEESRKQGVPDPKRHLALTETLSFSDLLPDDITGLKIFCSNKEYEYLIAGMFNEEDIKVLLKTKRASIVNFYRFVKKNCDMLN